MLHWYGVTVDSQPIPHGQRRKRKCFYEAEAVRHSVSVLTWGIFTRRRFNKHILNTRKKKNQEKSFTGTVWTLFLLDPVEDKWSCKWENNTAERCCEAFFRLQLCWRAVFSSNRPRVCLLYMKPTLQAMLSHPRPNDSCNDWFIEWLL